MSTEDLGGIRTSLHKRLYTSLDFAFERPVPLMIGAPSDPWTPADRAFSPPEACRSPQSTFVTRDRTEARRNHGRR
jgi:hypothetical protein